MNGQSTERGWDGGIILYAPVMTDTCHYTFVRAQNVPECKVWTLGSRQYVSMRFH